MFRSIFSIINPLKLAGDSTFYGAGSGAATGAALGSVVPGVGTAIGAGVGALAGGVSSWLKGKSEKKLREDEAKRYNEYLESLGANRDQVRQAMADAGFSFFDPSTYSGTSSSAGSYDKSGFRNEDSRQQQRYVGFDPQRDEALLKALTGRAFRPGVAQSGELMRGLSNVNRAFGQNQSSIRNQAARRGLGSLGQIQGTMADQGRLAALQGEFGSQANREEERRRYDMNALNAALMARQGQDTNRQLRARYGESGTDQRMGTQSSQSFDPGAAAMNALNFENTGLAPTASPLTGSPAPWAVGTLDAVGAGAKALQEGMFRRG